MTKTEKQRIIQQRVDDFMSELSLDIGVSVGFLEQAKSVIRRIFTELPSEKQQNVIDTIRRVFKQQTEVKSPVCESGQMDRLAENAVDLPKNAALTTQKSAFSKSVVVSAYLRDLGGFSGKKDSVKA